MKFKLSAITSLMVLLLGCVQCSSKDSTESFFTKKFVEGKLPLNVKIIEHYVELDPIGDYFVLVKLECSEEGFSDYLERLGCRKKLNASQLNMASWKNKNQKWWNPNKQELSKGVNVIYKLERISFSAGYVNGIGYLEVETW